MCVIVLATTMHSRCVTARVPTVLELETRTSLQRSKRVSQMLNMTSERNSKNFSRCTRSVVRNVNHRYGVKVSKYARTMHLQHLLPPLKLPPNRLNDQQMHHHKDLLQTRIRTNSLLDRLQRILQAIRELRDIRVRERVPSNVQDNQDMPRILHSKPPLGRIHGPQPLPRIGLRSLRRHNMDSSAVPLTQLDMDKRKHLIISLDNRNRSMAKDTRHRRRPRRRTRVGPGNSPTNVAMRFGELRKLKNIYFKKYEIRNRKYEVRIDAHNFNDKIRRFRVSTSLF